jgi:Arylsulfotransferase (ASST)
LADEGAARHTRRQFLILAGGVVTAGAVAASCGSTPTTPSAPTTASYKSRPDLTPSLIEVTQGSGTPASGLVCVTPSGPLLVDNTGQPVWIRKVPGASTNLRVQMLQRRPVLTWWQGEIAPYGVGVSGEYVILDGSYRQIMTVKAKNGLAADLHEFLITGGGVAYFTAYRTYTADLRSVGGPQSGRALDATIQGVDLASGTLVFDWSSAEHIDFSESEQKYSGGAPYDPVHLNSIDITPDGKLLASARNTWTVYKIDPASGEILWRLGGKMSDFTLGPGARFAWQHDARTHADGTLSLFDDEGDPPEAKQSRGLVLAVDETARTANVRTQYFHPKKALLAGSQGSVQLLPGGDVMIGWGAEPYYTELQADGTVVLDGKFAQGTSYRAFRFDWTGRPTDVPAVAHARSASGQTTVYVSWNGSTETARWRLLAGRGPAVLRPAADVERRGFETAIGVPAGATRAAVEALDAAGSVLARSRTLSI